MKKIIILLAFIAVSCITKAQFIVKLVDYHDSIMPANCGKQPSTYGLLKIVMKEKTPDLNVGDTIFIFQLCPREYMTRIIGKYNNDELYRVYLGTRVTPSYLTIARKFAKEKYGAFTDNQLWNGALRKYVR